MPGLRHVVLVPVVCVLLLAGALPSAQAAERALPETVVVNDGNTSDPIVNISQVRLKASWYWDSEQSLRVKVPNGFRAGHKLTVWFDLNGDSTPDGHFELRLREPKHAGGKSLQKSQEFRRGGGWSHGGNRVVHRLRGRAAGLRADQDHHAERGHLPRPVVVPRRAQPRRRRLGLVAGRGQPLQGQERGHGPQPPRLEQAGGRLGSVRPRRAASADRRLIPGRAGSRSCRSCSGAGASERR